MKRAAVTGAPVRAAMMVTGRDWEMKAVGLAQGPEPEQPAPGLELTRFPHRADR